MNEPLRAAMLAGADALRFRAHGFDRMAATEPTKRTRETLRALAAELSEHADVLEREAGT